MGKATKLIWAQVDKSNWRADIDGEALPARIRMLDTKTYSVYRDGRYLGSEATPAAAQERAATNMQSEKNRTMRAWEETHPDELPPGLQLTDVERAEYWRRHPPARPAPMVRGAGGSGRAARDVPKAVGVQTVTERNQPWDAGKEAVTGRVKAERSATSSAPKTGDGPALPRNKTPIILALLRGKRGCTREEVLRATGWTAVSMQQQAKAAAVGLRVDKSSKPYRYFAEEV